MSASTMNTSSTTTTRKRNNSIIPMEFRNDTNGGMERAALATVFGVKEYTESKIFWNSEEEEDEASFKPVQRSTSKRSTNSRHVQHTSNHHQNNNINNNCGNKILPIIPVVSEFGDIWSQLNSTTPESVNNNNVNPFSISPPADLSDYPLTLFDLINSDDNPNLILWGINHNVNNTIPPTAPNTHEEDDLKKKKSRWSAHQFLPDSLRKKSTLNNNTATQTSTTGETRVIEAATIEKLVEKLTISLDYTFMTDFFLIFRVFMTPLQLCKFLITRFRWSIENNEEERCIVRIRTFVVMRHWLLNYFLHDFIPSRELRIELTSFLNAMPFHPLIKQSPRDQRIIKGLKRVVRRLKKIYYASSSSATKVKVIGPPPLTSEQAKVVAMVKDKLSQSTIKQKTLNIVDGIHVDARHSSNTAIKNTSAAPVVVIGNYPSRKRPTSASSTPITLKSQDAASEWAKLNQLEYQARNVSDNSLESAISPGTSDNEEEDEEEDDDVLSEFGETAESFIHTNHIRSEDLSRKLEQLRQQQEEEDERNRAEFFLSSSYNQNPTHQTTELTLSHPIHNQDMRLKSFYNPLLAIPSNPTTPDIYYPPAASSYFDTNENNLILSTSFNSMAYPSVTDSEIVTPAGDYSTRMNYIHDSRNSKVLYDLKNKPLPSLDPTVASSSSSIGSYVKSKKLPKGPVDDPEVWKFSSRDKQSLQESRHGDSSLTEASQTPRSRIVELDIDNNHYNIPPVPSYIKPQENKSIVLRYSTSLMAQQFCLIEKAILLDINWEELVDCRWTKMSTNSPLYQPDVMTLAGDLNHLSLGQQGMYSRQKRLKQQQQRNNDTSERGIEKAINRFNAVCQWVSSEIVQTRNVEDRARLIEKFIRLAKKCKMYCNFTSLIQILLGLQSSSVSRLEKTWPLVKRRELKILQELSTFTSPTKNWKNIRDCMTQVAEEYGESPTEIQVQIPQNGKKKQSKSSVTIKLPFGGCIPFLGIYLSDLVFNAELPSYLPSPNSSNARRHRNAMDQVLSQPLVHFRKHRITATVIKRVLVFQNLAKRYSFEASDELLYSTCLQVSSLDSDTIYKKSCEIEE